MTNFEYYKEEILKLVDDYQDFGIFNNKPVACQRLNCDECQLDKENCTKGLFDWLYAEHVEQPKLTKKERQFCELVETGWLARDSDRRLFLFKKKPVKHDGMWDSIGCRSYLILDKEMNFVESMDFTFITWDDAEPWSIEDLLKLEVEE